MGHSEAFQPYQSIMTSSVIYGVYASEPLPLSWHHERCHLEAAFVAHDGHFHAGDPLVALTETLAVFCVPATCAPHVLLLFFLPSLNVSQPERQRLWQNTLFHVVDVHSLLSRKGTQTGRCIVWLQCHTRYVSLAPSERILYGEQMRHLCQHLGTADFPVTLVMDMGDKPPHVFHIDMMVHMLCMEDTLYPPYASMMWQNG